MKTFSLILLAVGILTLSSTQDSRAALVFYNVNQTAGVGTPIRMGSIQTPPNGTFTLGSTTGPSFGIETALNGMFSGINKDVEWAAGPAVTGSAYLYNGNILKFGSGVSISIGSSSNWTFQDPGFAQDGHPGNWNAGGLGYAGLRIDAGGGSYYYGWVELNYNSGADTVTVNRFAFQDTLNTAALTGASAVPEPGQLAASLLLLIGIGGYAIVARRKALLPNNNITA